MLKKIKSFVALHYSRKQVQKGNYRKGIRILEKALEQDPNNPFLNLHLGLALSMDDRIQEAKVCLLLAQKVQPSNPVHSLFLGKILVDSEQYEDSIPYLNNSLELNDDNLLAWGYLALAHLRMGNIEEFEKITTAKGISGNRDLQIRIILGLEHIIRGITIETESPGK